MRWVILPLLAGFTLTSVPAAADDVWVDGYYRDDGTYVEPHIRSSPDDSVTNNYGPSENDYQRLHPNARDYDDDGLSNQYEFDSDGDGINDDLDSDPYSSDSGLYD